LRSVADPVVLQDADDLDEVVAPALEEVEAAAPVLLQLRRERALCRLHDQDGAAHDLDQLERLHDQPAAPQRAQHLELVAQPLGALRVTGDLEHLVAAVALGEQHDGGATGPEPALDRPGASDPLPDDRLDRVGLLGPRQQLFGDVEVLEELLDRDQPDAGVDLRRRADHHVEVAQRAVLRGGQAELALLPQRRSQGVEVRCRRLPGQDKERHGAQREQVGGTSVDGVAARAGQLGREVQARGPRDEAVDVRQRGAGDPARRGGAEPSRACMPVPDAQPGAAPGAGHHDAARGQRPMGEPLPMGEPKGLRQLADQADAVEQVQLVAAVGQPQVQRLSLRVMVEQQSRAAIVVHVLERCVDPGVAQVAQQLELAPSSPAQGRLLIGWAGALRQIDTDAHLAVDVRVPGEVVLPVVAVRKDLLQLVRADPTHRGRLADPSLAHRLSDPARQRRVHARAMARVDPGEELDDARQRGSRARSRGRVTPIYRSAPKLVELAVQPWIGQEHGRLNVEPSATGSAERRLVQEQGFEYLRLPVGQRQRVVHGPTVLATGLRPRPRIPGQRAPVVLDLDEMDPGG